MQVVISVCLLGHSSLMECVLLQVGVEWSQPGRWAGLSLAVEWLIMCCWGDWFKCDRDLVHSYHQTCLTYDFIMALSSRTMMWECQCSDEHPNLQMTHQCNSDVLHWTAAGKSLQGRSIVSATIEGVVWECLVAVTSAMGCPWWYREVGTSVGVWNVIFKVCKVRSCAEVRRLKRSCHQLSQLLLWHDRLTWDPDKLGLQWKEGCVGSDQNIFV